MITEDIEIVKKIFELIQSGIVEGYDAFRYEAEVCEGYIVVGVSIEKNGTLNESPKTNFDGAILYRLVKELKASAASRGENWRSFVMSYSVGGQVKTNFVYP
ncbi:MULTISPECIES: hypothetical protein [unclassified Pseudomonas]|uniref:hypothetical protein n=1 Tax=unclassified Pseudomonas TaxID=196821 RepID=UPI001F58929C|nr:MULTISPECIES: hypothetical protein [unclassified Pseudomonas]